MLSDRQAKEHVLNRVALGPNENDSQRYDTLGRIGYIDEELSRAHNLTASEVANWTSNDPPNGYAASLAHVAAAPLKNWEYYQRWHITRAIPSQRQLLEVLLDFWWNHFNIAAGSPNEVACWRGWTKFYMGLAERALGPFEDLMRFATMSHSMQDYLDNVYNTVGEPNENLGREILELHTMGEGRGYTQADVVAASQILTGWKGGVVANGMGVPTGPATLSYVASRHDTSAKTFLGQSFPAGVDGQAEQDRFLGIIANHPKTQEYISWRLCQLFVADDPPADLVASTTAIFDSTGGDLHDVVRHILTSDQFLDESVYRAKVKKPRDFVVSLARAFGCESASDIDDEPSSAVSDEGFYGAKEYTPVAPAMRFMRDAGETLFFNTVPTGYSNEGVDWMSGVQLAARFELVTHAADNWRSHLGISSTLSTDDFVDALEARFAPGGFSEQTRVEIIDQVHMLSGDGRLHKGAWLAASSPEFASY